MKNENKKKSNSFYPTEITIRGVCESDLMEERDFHGNFEHTLLVATQEKYPQQFKIHFYKIYEEWKRANLKGRMIVVKGYVKGKTFNKTVNGKLYVNEWVQIRGNFLEIENKEEPLEIDKTLISEEDLPF